MEAVKEAAPTLLPYVFTLRGRPEDCGLVIRAGKVEVEVIREMRTVLEMVDAYEDDGTPWQEEVDVERPVYRTRVTCHPGAHVEWGYSSRHEEGWSSYSEEIGDDGDCWEIESVSDGSDCDGRNSTTRHFTSPGGLVNATDPRSPDAVGRPARVYDQFAQMMDY